MNITAGKYKGYKITTPDENITRPTLSKVRMGIFNSLQSMMDFEDKSFLDVYCGSGIMGLEAISRGFSHLVGIEKNKKVYSIAKINYNKIKDEKVKLLLGNSINICKKLDKNFDVIYIDPPYFSGIYEDTLNAIRNITSGIVILEHVTDVDFLDYKVIKQKKYGDKYITYLTLEN